MPNFSFKDTLLRFNAGFLSARIGEWLFAVALNWVLFVQSESPLLLAIINACRLLPNLIFSIPAGRLADNFCRRKLNGSANALNAIFILLIGLALHWQLPFWVCALLVVARAITTACEGPFRNAYLCSLFQGAELKRVVAQNASVMNLGRIIGPIVAGALLASGGSLLTFALASAATFLYAGILSYLPDGEICQERRKPKGPLLQNLGRYPQLKKLFLLAIPVMFFGFPFTAMLPMITETMLKLGAEQFGTLLAISAAGALLASSLLAVRPDYSNWYLTRLYALFFGLSLSGLIFVNGFYGAAILLLLIGFLGQAYRTSSRMLFQEIVPKDQAGSLLGLALMDRGMIPLGGLLVGAVAEHWSPLAGVAVMGLGCLFTVALFFPLGFYQRPLALTALATALASVLLTGCQSQPPSTNKISGPVLEVTHVWGKSEVPLKPQKIVVLDLPFFDAFCALGEPVSGFAGTSEQEVPAYLETHLLDESKPIFVGERKQPNLEVILSLKPDLIIANPDRHKMIRAQLESIAPTIALTDDSMADVRKMVTLFGQISGKSEEAQNIIDKLSQSIEMVKLEQDGEPLVLVAGAFEDEFSTWTKGSFIGSLFEEAGARYAYQGSPSASESQTEVAKLTVEGLAQLNPDYLFLYGDPERWSDNPIFSGLSAKQNNKVFKIDRDLWSRARGPVAAQLILDGYSNFLSKSDLTAKSF